MLFVSPESQPKSPGLRAAIESCHGDYAWGENFMHTSLLREFPDLWRDEVPAAPVVSTAPVIALPSEVTSAAIDQTARYAVYEESADARRLAELRRQVQEQALSAEERIYGTAA